MRSGREAREVSDVHAPNFKEKNKDSKYDNTRLHISTLTFNSRGNAEYSLIQTIAMQQVLYLKSFVGALLRS